MSDDKFPNLSEEDIKKAAENTKTFDANEKPPQLVCPKHGEINDLYAFRVNMPDFGYENKHYCLVCAIEYLSMIANELEFKEREEETK